MVEPPSKEDREVCWNSRDDYWKCLDSNNNEPNKCVNERNEYEKHCPNSWIKHFDRRREYLKFKAKMESGEHQLRPRVNK